MVAAVLVASALMAPALAAATCYNPDTRRDTWLASWVAWIPARGQKANYAGQAYRPKQAIAFAKRQIASGYAKRGADWQHSPVAHAVFAVLDSGANRRRAARRYAQSLEHAVDGNGSPLRVRFEDAAHCFERLQP